MQQETIKIQNNSKEWKLNSAYIHVTVTSQSEFQNSLEIVPDKKFPKMLMYGRIPKTFLKRQRITSTFSNTIPSFGHVVKNMYMGLPKRTP